MQCRRFTAKGWEQLGGIEQPGVKEVNGVGEGRSGSAAVMPSRRSRRDSVATTRSCQRTRTSVISALLLLVL